MKVKELFEISDIKPLIENEAHLLSKDNCCIVNFTKNIEDKTITIQLERGAGKICGTAILRVRDEWGEVSNQLIEKIFYTEKPKYCTLNQLNELDINVSNERLNRKLQVKI